MPSDLAHQPWWVEMCDSLARYEAHAPAVVDPNLTPVQQQAMTTRHRAFFAALRTQLSEVAADDVPASRAARLRAAHLWWAKHR